MRRVILHIGLPKTGSSSIQASLSGVDTGDVRVVRFGENLFHNLPLSTLLSDDPARMRQHLNRGHSPEAIAARRARWDTAFTEELARDTPTLVLSSEVISNAGDAALLRLKDRIEGSGRRLEVFGYVREPMGLFGSALQQRLKQFDRLPRDFDPFQYRKRLAVWVDALPPDQLTLRDFVPANLTGSSPVRDFADFCAIPGDAYREKQRNESLNAEVTRLLYIFNGAMAVSTGRPRLAEARKRFLRLLKQSIDGPRFKTPLACIDPERLALELEWLAAHTGLDYRAHVAEHRHAMLTAPLDDEMRRLAPETRARLDALVNEAGLTLPPGAGPARQLAALYLDLLAPETPAPRNSRIKKLLRTFRLR
ncbi:hypothetical protein [Maritimibacter sp. UBA3975]|uniref:hypothetical protein n=1 Tax=Maritimibacter sp. UBA3975 TaxID=1946833 RepID=UPI000C0A7388|nr:hypothetical protein [Maritimibacter sp. UBA3975]MAM62561.1 hypothetical protein [Maritimibacter sp.]|tara:strand:- start:7871 stop:8965 length:1095 start_codon:yes stop_codon:yes gene_type:complete